MIFPDLPCSLSFHPVEIFLGFPVECAHFVSNDGLGGGKNFGQKQSKLKTPTEFPSGGSF